MVQSSSNILEVICSFSNDNDKRSTVAPLRLLTVINTSNKELFQNAVILKGFGSHAVSWNEYAAKLLLLACEYNSNNFAALLVSPASLPESTLCTFLRTKACYGDLPIHIAAQKGRFTVIDELLKAEKRSTVSQSQGNHPDNGDAIAVDNTHTPLLYIPDVLGRLPIHLAANLRHPQIGPETIKMMLRYDTEHATLFPASILKQQDVSNSTQKRTSMLLSEGRLGPCIHRSSNA